MAPTIADEQILDAALTVIAQKGYAGATTREIAAEAGINEVTLFRRFGNKKKLLMTAVEQEAEKFAAAGVAYTGDIAADLQRVVEFYRGMMQTRGSVIMMLMSEIPRQPDLLEVVQTPLTLLGKVTAIIERYQQEGQLVNEPPLQAFAALLGPLMLRGVIGMMHPDSAAVPFDPAVQVQHYLHGRRP